MIAVRGRKPPCNYQAHISLRSKRICLSDMRNNLACSKRSSAVVLLPSRILSMHISEAVKKLFAGGSPIDHEYAILAP